MRQLDKAVIFRLRNDEVLYIIWTKLTLFEESIFNITANFWNDRTFVQIIRTSE